MELGEFGWTSDKLPMRKLETDFFEIDASQLVSQREEVLEVVDVATGQVRGVDPKGLKRVYESLDLFSDVF